MPRTVLFDFDGVVVDTELLIVREWEREFAEAGVNLDRAAWSRHWFTSEPGSRLKRTGTLDLLRSARSEAGLRDEFDYRASWLRQKRRVLRARNDLCPRPGIVRWILAARSNAKFVGIVSNERRTEIATHVSRLEIAHLFDFIVGSEDVAIAKPSAIGYQHALILSGSSGDDSLAVEDSPIGWAAARGAGIKCAYVPTELTSLLPIPPGAIPVDPELVSLTDIQTVIESEAR